MAAAPLLGWVIGLIRNSRLWPFIRIERFGLATASLASRVPCQAVAAGSLLLAATASPASALICIDQ